MHSVVKKSNIIVPISVIIPCYNCESTIRLALNSVFEQTNIPNEIILVDDYSDDNTVGVIQGIINSNPDYNIKMLRSHNNLGPGNARNIGWDNANNDWLAFLDADDIWHPQKLEFQWRFLKKNQNVDLCGHNSLLFNKIELYDIKQIFTIKNIRLNQMLISNSFPTRTIIIKKSLPFRFGGKNVTEDYLLWLEIIANNHIAVKIDAVFAYSLRPEYSKGGYSGNLWKHETKELNALIMLYQKGKISVIILFLTSLWSVMKYTRRLILIKLR